MSNLILSRRIGEKVMMTDPNSGNIIEVTVVGINQNQVKMSFCAPREVTVDRFEIYEKRLAG